MRSSTFAFTEKLHVSLVHSVLLRTPLTLYVCYVLTCWHVKNRAAITNVPAIPWAVFVCRKIGSEGAEWGGVTVVTCDVTLATTLAAANPKLATVVAFDILTKNCKKLKKKQLQSTHTTLFSNVNKSFRDYSNTNLLHYKHF